MRVPAIAALGIAAYAVFLAATTPASVIASHVQSRSAGAIEFIDTTGTLWHGTARARVGTPGGPLVIERLEWRYRPAALASGRIAFDLDVQANAGNAQLALARGFTDWEVRDLQAQVSAQILATFLPLAATWRPEGSIRAAAPALTWNEREMHGTLTLDWKDAAVALSEVRPLGSYRVEAVGDGGVAQLNATTASGPLRISGKGQFSPPSRIVFSGEARGEGEAAKALEPLLDLLGPRRPDGARTLEMRPISPRAAETTR
jgi:general secretion pathway protein N